MLTSRHARLFVYGFVAILVVAAVSGTTVGALYNGADIDSKLINGRKQAVAWDKLCWNQMRANRDAGMAPRTAINTGGAYQKGSWLSAAGTGSQTSVSVSYGTTAVSLQMNSITFLCSSLVSPDGQGADYPYTDPRVVRATNAPNDRAPNPMGGQTNWPAFTGERLQVQPGSTVTGGGGVSIASGGIMSHGRQGDTRYWFASPLALTYNAPAGGLTETQTFIVSVPVKQIVQYYNNQEYCVGDTTNRQISGWDYGQCPTIRLSFAITIEVTNNHDIYPKVFLDGSDVIATGQDSVASAKVFNDGSTASGAEIPNVIHEFVLPAGASVPDFSTVFTDEATLQNNDTVRYLNDAYTADDNQAGCRWIASKYPVIPGLCKASSPWGSRSIGTSNSWQDVGDGASKYTINGDNYAVGQKVCRFLAIGRYDASHPADDVRQRISVPVCVTVGKKPSIQVWGGDVAVRRDISTGIYWTAGQWYGSWGEYGIALVGANSGMASGSGLNLGSGSSNQGAWSKLTLANIGGFGSYPLLTTRNFPGIVDRLAARKSSTLDTPSITDINTLEGSYKRSGDLTLSGGVLDKGKTVIIQASGTVTIAGDLGYTTEPLASIRDIPQLVIIARNIEINDNVTSIDAWLVASSGTIDTCSNQPAKLSVLLCENQLRVNGPVIADKIQLRRTAGAGIGGAAGVPAEIFNLRPDAYLWALTMTENSGKAVTTSTIEMAPRF